MRWEDRLCPSGRRYFKFIGGANLLEAGRVETLAALFTLAGAAIFDVAAEPEMVRAVGRGAERARAWLAAEPDWLRAAYGERPRPEGDLITMVSVTLEGDRHTEIAVVEEALCTSCDLCTEVCPPGAIVNGVVDTRICTGCRLCVSVCPPLCIEMRPREAEWDLAGCWEAGARALEIHTGAAAPAEIARGRAIGQAWQARGGLLAYSLDGHQLGHRRVVALGHELGGPGVILQADGRPISGTVGDRSTIPALRLARSLSRAGAPGLIQVAGGTNDRTGPLAERHRVPLHGVGMGSFARRIAKPLEEPGAGPRAWETALRQALNLVESVRGPVAAGH